MFNEFKEDNNILAILSSPQSQDAYEQYLYPKAKDTSVDYLISKYGGKKYFFASPLYNILFYSQKTINSDFRSNRKTSTL